MILESREITPVKCMILESREITPVKCMILESMPGMYKRYILFNFISTISFTNISVKKMSDIHEFLVL